MKEIEVLYDCLGKLEEAYQAECVNYQESLAINQARMRLGSAIAKIEALLTQPAPHKEEVGVSRTIAD